MRAAARRWFEDRRTLGSIFILTGVHECMYIENSIEISYSGEYET
eukprot:COSAG02_NODE_68433_length_245_cov_2.109589_1_plen_44_part_10